jgi:hypothetical protein
MLGRFTVLLGICAFLAGSVLAQAAEPVRDWTLLVYMNGDNSLDTFGPVNLRQMETVGSTDHLNIVVQWASSQNGKTQRLLVKKSTDPSNVTSPIVQDLGVVDMGDYHSLEAFIEWGAANYPARHYFVDVWDHGSGWHSIEAMSTIRSRHLNPTDISWDDGSGNSITTKQLGQAIADASQSIGQKIDIYGSDACMMGMAEVAAEMKDSASYFLGSQEVEPGAGWPYDTFLQRWTSNPSLTAVQVSTALAEEYSKSYSGGSNGNSSATMAVYDLSKQDELEAAVTQLGASILKLAPEELSKVAAAANATQAFTDSDYGDLKDFANRIGENGTRGIGSENINAVMNAYQDYVISNEVTSNFASAANGVSIWLPKSQSDYSSYTALYETMNFEIRTGWGKAVEAIVNASNSTKRLR